MIGLDYMKYYKFTWGDHFVSMDFPRKIIDQWSPNRKTSPREAN